MSVIASTDVNNQNDDVLFDKKTMEKLQKVDIEELEYDEDSDDQAMDDDIVINGKKIKKLEHAEEEDDEMGDDSDDIDDNVKRVEKMA